LLDIDVKERQGSGACEVTAGGTTGSLLCRALVRCYDAVVLKPQDQQQFFVMKATVINALKSLLAISATAKTTALERKQ